MGAAAAEARMAEEFFTMFISTQLLAVAVLTPAYVAGSIADEKDRKTLEFLLATDLRNREIVLSKLVARMANIILFILTGLPLVSMIQFLGGVDPMLVQAGFAATALTMLGLAGVSILASTWCRRPREAIGLAYLVVVLYLVLSSTLYATQAMSAHDRGRGIPVTEGFSWPICNYLANAFNAGNLFLYIPGLRTAGGGGVLDKHLPGMVGEYAIFHLLLAGVCTAWAVLRLRAVALKQMLGKGPKGSAVRRLEPRPPVGNRPMIWKEVFAEGGRRFRITRWLTLTLLIVSACVPAILVMVNNLSYRYAQRPSGNEFLMQMNAWAVRVPGTLVGCLMLLAVAVRASTSFSGERDRQTLDSLLTTPLDSTPILVGKWLGAILSVRLGMLWLVVLWSIGIATGALSPVGMLLAAAAWLVFAAFAATLGLWFSILCSTSLRSTIWTLMTAVGVSLGHWLPWLCCAVMPMLGSVEYIARVQAGLTPPVVLAVLPVSGAEFTDEFGGSRGWVEMVGFSLFGIFAWAVATVLLYSGLTLRFRAVTLREEFTRPESGWMMRRPRVVLEPAPNLPPVRAPERPAPRPPTRTEEPPVIVVPPPDLRPPPTRLTGAKLVEETWDPPPPKPKPKPDGDGPGRA
jgi:ABC-type transport system involved in multi-copper enzyme maturation permease subunit